MAVTIKTLADALNLSTASVSKALNNSYDISASTKLRVKQLAEELHYVPDLYASSLRRRKSRTIALVIPEVADSFFAQVINGIEAKAKEKGYHLLIYLTHENFEREKSILNDFQGGRVDGVLISASEGCTDADHIKELMQQNIPVVFFDRVADEVETAKIVTDDFNSSYVATRHLIESGCKNIVFLSVSDSLSIMRQRKEGFQKAIRDSEKISHCTGKVAKCSIDAGNNYRLIKNLMTSAGRPDGLIASVEKLSYTVYFVCRESGITIPGQLKVVGFSNLQTALLLDPPLTTISQPAYEMGNTAATILFNALTKKKYEIGTDTITILSRLEIRGSSVAAEK